MAIKRGESLVFEKRDYLLFVVGFLLVILGGIVLFGGLSDRAGRDSAAGKQLDVVREQQQNVASQLDAIAAGIGDGKNRVDAAETAIDNVAESIESSQRTIATSQQAIDDYRRILAEVRARGEVKN